MWVRLIRDYDHNRGKQVTVAYKAGHVVNLPASAAGDAEALALIAAGAAEEVEAPSKAQAEAIAANGNREPAGVSLKVVKPAVVVGDKA